MNGTFMELTQLFDLYAELLTDRQRSILELYLSEDLGHVEIAENLGISRQAVYDHVSKSSEALYKYEKKLGFLKKLQAIEQSLARAKTAIRQIETGEGTTDLTALLAELNAIKTIY